MRKRGLCQIEFQWHDMQMRLINPATYKAAGGSPVFERRNGAFVNPKPFTEVSSKRHKGLPLDCIHEAQSCHWSTRDNQHPSWHNRAETRHRNKVLVACHHDVMSRLDVTTRCRKPGKLTARSFLACSLHCPHLTV